MTLEGFNETIGRYLSPADREVVASAIDLSSSAAAFAGAKADRGVRVLKSMVKERADRLKNVLSRLPHHIAAIVVTGLRDPMTSRRLTKGEISSVGQAFGSSALPLARKCFVSNGAGTNPIAVGAFINGNPAITLGNVIYMDMIRWKPDFAAAGEDLPLFLHEFTHVIQWDRMGYAVFLRRYLREKEAAGSANAMYDYASRRTDFGHETLEGQAQIVQDYTSFRRRLPPGGAKAMADLERRLTGSRVYGL